MFGRKKEEKAPSRAEIAAKEINRILWIVSREGVKGDEWERVLDLAEDVGFILDPFPLAVAKTLADLTATTKGEK